MGTLVGGAFNLLKKKKLSVLMTFENVKTTHSSSSSSPPLEKKIKRWETRTTNFRPEIFKKMNVEGREMEKEKSGRPGQQQLLLCHHHHHHHHGRCNLITTGTVQQRHQPKKLKKV